MNTQTEKINIYRAQIRAKLAKNKEYNITKDGLASAKEYYETYGSEIWRKKAEELREQRFQVNREERRVMKKEHEKTLKALEEQLTEIAQQEINSY